MQVNPYSLGYKCVGNIGINTSAEYEETVTEFLKKKATSVYPSGILENITFDF